MREQMTIKSEIKDLKREMKANGIRRVSCFNGGLNSVEQRCNTQLFRLQTELEKAIKEQGGAR